MMKKIFKDFIGPFVRTLMAALARGFGVGGTFGRPRLPRLTAAGGVKLYKAATDGSPAIGLPRAAGVAFVAADVTHSAFGGASMSPATAAAGTLRYISAAGAARAARAYAGGLTLVGSVPVVTIYLFGEQEMTLEAATEEYQEPGAIALDIEGNQYGITYIGTINNRQLGAQYILYLADNADTVVRTVTVADTTAPVITVNHPEGQFVLVGATEKYVDPPVTVNDAYDGNLINSLVRVYIGGWTDTTMTPGVKYTRRFICTDSSGNQSVKEITALKAASGPDTTIPVIILNGPSTQYISPVTGYTELGATAEDDRDGVITSAIVIDASAVDASVVDTPFIVTYNVSDAAGNAAVEVQRTVISQAVDLTGLLLERPTLHAVGGLTGAYCTFGLPLARGVMNPLTQTIELRDSDETTIIPCQIDSEVTQHPVVGPPGPTSAATTNFCAVAFKADDLAAAATRQFSVFVVDGSKNSTPWELLSESLTYIDGQDDYTVTLTAPTMSINITDVTKVTDYRVTSANHGLQGGYRVVLSGVNSGLNGNVYRIDNVTTNAFDLTGTRNINAGSYSGGGTATYGPGNDISGTWTASMQSAMKGSKVTLLREGPLLREWMAIEPFDNAGDHADLHMIWFVRLSADDDIECTGFIGNGYITGGKKYHYNWAFKHGATTLRTNPANSCMQHAHHCWPAICGTDTRWEGMQNYFIGHETTLTGTQNYLQGNLGNFGPYHDINISLINTNWSGAKLYYPFIQVMNQNLQDPGERNEIGPMTTFCTLAMLRQHPNLDRDMKVRALGHGSVFSGYREAATGEVPVINSQDYSSDGMGNEDRSVVKIGQEGTLVDEANSSSGYFDYGAHHMGDANYCPYMMSGDVRFRLLNENLAIALILDLDIHNGRVSATVDSVTYYGLVTSPSQWQVRAGSWHMRTLSNCAWVYPDALPARNYWDRLVSDNWTYTSERMAKSYALGGHFDELRAMGIWKCRIGDPVPVTQNHFGAGWQQDFMAMVTLLNYPRRYSKASFITNFVEKFATGRAVRGHQARAYGYHFAYYFPGRSPLWATDFTEVMIGENYSGIPFDDGTDPQAPLFFNHPNCINSGHAWYAVQGWGVAGLCKWLTDIGEINLPDGAIIDAYLNNWNEQSPGLGRGSTTPQEWASHDRGGPKYAFRSR